MSRHAKIRDGKEIFYSKLAVYLDLIKHKNPEKLGAIYGVSGSTMRRWMEGFNRSRLEGLLKNFQAGGGEEGEATLAGGDTLEEIRQVLLRQARNGSVAAAKAVLELEQAEGKDDEEALTVEGAIELLRQWNGPRICSRCGQEDEFKYQGGAAGAIPQKRENPLLCV